MAEPWVYSQKGKKPSSSEASVRQVLYRRFTGTIQGILHNPADVSILSLQSKKVGSEMLSNLPEPTQLENGRAGAVTDA